MNDKVGHLATTYRMVNVYWGNEHYAVHITTCPANEADVEATKWFKENDHFFHLERFPPYRRHINHGTYTTVDYGSYANFLYLIPVNI